MPSTYPPHLSRDGKRHEGFTWASQLRSGGQAREVMQGAGVGAAGLGGPVGAGAGWGVDGCREHAREVGEGGHAQEVAQGVPRVWA